MCTTKVYLSEYKANTLTEEAYEAWLNNSLRVIAETVQVPDDHIYSSSAGARKAGWTIPENRGGGHLLFRTGRRAEVR